MFEPNRLRTLSPCVCTSPLSGDVREDANRWGSGAEDTLRLGWVAFINVVYKLPSPVKRSRCSRTEMTSGASPLLPEMFFPPRHFTVSPLRIPFPFPRACNDILSPSSLLRFSSSHVSTTNSVTYFPVDVCLPHGNLGSQRSRSSSCSLM